MINAMKGKEARKDNEVPMDYQTPQTCPLQRRIEAAVQRAPYPLTVRKRQRDNPCRIMTSGEVTPWQASEDHQITMVRSTVVRMMVP
jgi:hypothetical protein